MYDMGIKGTKWLLFTVSVDLFAEKGYESVSVRDIAEAAGIKASSIYNHFKSKVEILYTMYDFYDYYYVYFMPTLDSIVDYIGTEPPADTLKRVLFRFDPSIQDIMDKIFLIASVQLYCDLRAQQMIFKNIFTLSEEFLSVLLNKMIEADIIEPIDVDSFILIMNSICHSSALRMRTSFPIDWDVWVRSANMVYSLVREKGK